MKEYKFVDANVKGIQFNYKKVRDNYREIINQHAAEGWKLVQIVVVLDGVVEIVFERDK